MSDALELADRLWRGQERIEDHHPVGYQGDLVEPQPGIGFVPSLANVTAFVTTAGLVLVDTGGYLVAPLVHEKLRAWAPGVPLDTAIYSHGHVDHVFGVPLFEREAEESGWPAPWVVAHENVPLRFDRYRQTAGYNAWVNRRQFGIPDLEWPTEYRYPDETYHHAFVLEVGEDRFELNHAWGETDDHTWTWIPTRGVLCCGDLFIWAAPNAGNPQKAQRHPKFWTDALRRMAELDAEVMLPGHGPPVLGPDRVRAALEDTASLLESLLEQSLALMNRGARLDELIHTVRAPADLLERPYLRPVYDEPEFIVRNIWRLYGGWYDGNPASLKPAPEADLAAELASLAGGAARLAERALETDDLRLAGHLAELAFLAAPDDDSVRAARAEVFGRRAEAEASTMARGVFGWAAREAGGE